MLHLLYVNPLNQDIISIKNLNLITVQISKEFGKLKKFNFYLSGLNMYDSNCYIFSIYEKHKKISQSNHNVFVDKDSIYMFETKEKAYHIDYQYISNLYDKNTGKLIDSKSVLVMPLKNFIEDLFKQNPKDLTILVKDIKNHKYENSNYNVNLLPKSIREEIAPLIVGGVKIWKTKKKK